MAVLALIPARSGSKGIPHKNFRELGGVPLFERAVRTALGAGCYPVVSANSSEWEWEGTVENAVGWLRRPVNLAQDDTPMIAVVQHALEQIPGSPDDIIVLLQPTQPFRKPEHVQQAIQLLQESGADSVVSVVELPLTHSPDLVCAIRRIPATGQVPKLQPWTVDYGKPWSWAVVPTRRQDAEPAYIRDGTVYAFRRQTVDRHQNLYGHDCRPLIIDPADSCELDSESDWQAVEKRWAERAAAPRS